MGTRIAAMFTASSPVGRIAEPVSCQVIIRRLNNSIRFGKHTPGTQTRGPCAFV